MLEARFKIEHVRTAADLEVTVQLFNEYASSVGVDLSYQDFATELASLPGKYASPMGELLLARDRHGEPVGCVGLRPIEPKGVLRDEASVRVAKGARPRSWPGADR